MRNTAFLTLLFSSLLFTACKKEHIGGSNINNVTTQNSGIHLSENNLNSLDLLKTRRHTARNCSVFREQTSRATLYNLRGQRLHSSGHITPVIGEFDQIKDLPVAEAIAYINNDRTVDFIDTVNSTDNFPSNLNYKISFPDNNSYKIYLAELPDSNSSFGTTNFIKVSSTEFEFYNEQLTKYCRPR